MSDKKESLLDKWLNALWNIDNVLDNYERLKRFFGGGNPDGIQRQVTSVLKDDDPMDKEIKQIDYEIEKWSSMHDQIRKSRNIFSHLYRDHQDKVNAEQKIINEIRRLQERKKELEKRNQEVHFKNAESDTRNKVNDARKNKSDVDLHVEKNKKEMSKLRNPSAPSTGPKRNNDLINHRNGQIDKLQEQIDKLTHENANLSSRKTIDPAVLNQINMNNAKINDLQNKIDQLANKIEVELRLPL